MCMCVCGREAHLVGGQPEAGRALEPHRVGDRLLRRVGELERLGERRVQAAAELERRLGDVVRQRLAEEMCTYIYICVVLGCSAAAPGRGDVHVYLYMCVVFGM